METVFYWSCSPKDFVMNALNKLLDSVGSKDMIDVTRKVTRVQTQDPLLELPVFGNQTHQ